MKLLQLVTNIGLAFVFTSVFAQSEPTPLIKTELMTLHNSAIEPLNTLKDRDLLAELETYSNKIEAIDIAAMHLSQGAFKRKKKLKEADLTILADLKANIEGTSTNARSWNDSIQIPILFFPWESNETVTLTVKGSFASYTTNQVYLSFYGTGKVHATSLSAEQASFTFVPNMLIVDPVAKPIGYNMLELNLEQGVGKKLQVDKVRFLVGHYPETLGKIRIATTSSGSVEKEVQHKKTRTFLLNAFKEDLVDKLCAPSHRGWKVVEQSIELVVESSSGVKNRDWNYRKTGRGANTCFQIEVFNNSAGSSGKLEYHLKYDIERSIEVEAKDMSDEQDLSWNQIYTIPLSKNGTITWFLPNGEEKVISAEQQPDLPGVMINIVNETLTIDTNLLPE